MAAAAPQDSAAEAAPAVVEFFPFAALPPPLLLQIFAALPADTRLRCAEVCTGWRATLAERSLWTRLDVSHTSGVMQRKTPALLRAVAARSGGALTALDVSGVWQRFYHNGTLREVLAALAGSLRELRCLHGRSHVLSVSMLQELLSAAPQLRVCEADLFFTVVADARRALRKEGVFGPLRVCVASVDLERAEEVATAAHVSLMDDVAAHASLTELYLHSVPFHVPEVLGAFVDAALSLPLLRIVKFHGCRLSPASAPALARLLSSGTLVELNIWNDRRALLDAPSAALLGDALLANTTLTSLTLHCAAVTLHGASVWSSHAAADALLRVDGAHTLAGAGDHA
jgi:hypothetical protein